MRRLSLRFDEKRDSNEANNHQGGTSDEDVPDMIARGARSNRYLVVVSHDRTFVRVHGMLLSHELERKAAHCCNLMDASFVPSPAPSEPSCLARINAHTNLYFENTYNNEAHQMLTTTGVLLNASSELKQLREENERLKEENEQLKRQIEQLKESIKKPNDRIDTLEEIIDERDDDIDSSKKKLI